MRLPCVFWLMDNTQVDVSLLKEGVYRFTYTFEDGHIEDKAYKLKKTLNRMEYPTGELKPYEEKALRLFWKHL